MNYELFGLSEIVRRLSPFGGGEPAHETFRDTDLNAHLNFKASPF